jgi:hypothetical protein
LTELQQFLPADLACDLIILTPEEYYALSQPREFLESVIAEARERKVPVFTSDETQAAFAGQIRQAEESMMVVDRIRAVEGYFLENESMPFDVWCHRRTGVEPSIDQLNKIYDALSRQWLRKLQLRLRQWLKLIESGKESEVPEEIRDRVINLKLHSHFGFSSYALHTGRIANGSSDYKLLSNLFGEEGQKVDLIDQTRWHFVIGIPIPGFPLLFSLVIPWQRPWLPTIRRTFNALLVRQRIAEGSVSSV